MPRFLKTDLARLRAALASSLSPACSAIVDIGCGFCPECDLLLELFSSATITVIDWDAACIDSLRRYLAVHSARLRFFAADAANMASYAPGPYDAMLVRHPDIDAHPQGWEVALRAALTHLRAGGILIVTVYTVSEAEYIQRLVRSLPLAIAEPGQMGEVPIALAGNDRYILICRKL